MSIHAASLCHPTVHGHGGHIPEKDASKSGDPASRIEGLLAVEERQQQRHRAHRSERQDAQDFAIHAQDFRWNQLQRLEHEEEVPLRLDAGWRGSKGIGLHAEVPGKQRCKRQKQTKRHIPCHQLAQRKVGEEADLALVPRRRLPLPFHLGRNAHAEVLNEPEVYSEQQSRDRRQDRDVKSEQPRQGAAGNVFATAQEQQDGTADDWDLPRYLRADFGGEIRKRVPRQQITAEAEGQHQKQQQNAAHPRQLARLPVGLQEEHAEQVGECHEHQQVRRPRMQRADEPPDLHLRDDELHALEGFVSAGTVIQQQQGAGKDLHSEEKQRHTAQKIPVRISVYRYLLLLGQCLDVVQMESLVEPRVNACDQARHQASCFRRTKISSPRTCTSKASSGRGGGPEMLRPFRSYMPLWQAHQISRRSGRYCTVQPRWVQVADIARYSPEAVSTRSPGRVPKRNVLAVFGLSSETRAASTASPPTSGSLGGTR